MRAFVLFAAIALSSAAPADGVSRSGLYGLVTRGPITPVCVAEQPCSKPAPGVRLTFTRGGVAKAVVTNALGRYRLALAPGRYSVRTGAAPGIGRGLEPSVVVVPAAWKRQPFSIDTGIR
jgi:hypothetical protein